MHAPELWIVAGPNGAGKTTCVQKEPISKLLPGVTFLNPDDRTLTKLRAAGYRGFVDAPVDVQTKLFIESANEVFDELEQAITVGRAVGVETVLSSDKYKQLVDSVFQAKGFVGLFYVALASPAIAKKRVAERVRRGGHGVPDEKIKGRWQRSLDNLAWFARHATAFWIFDNSDWNAATPPTLVAVGKHGKLEHLASAAFLEMKAALASLKIT